MRTPEEILNITVDTGVQKVQKPFLSKVILGFLGGAMVSLGYLAYVRVAAPIEAVFPGLGGILGSAIFPIGLMAILLAGGELVTSNMMVVSVSLFHKKVSIAQWALNLLTITLTNTLGALFVAYLFGHLTGLTSSGVYLEEVMHLAESKTKAQILPAFLSGIGCNWMVGLAVWMCYGAKEGAAKILSTWFIIAAFVAIGFQHSVANLFVIPAAMMEGYGSLYLLVKNIVPVYFGNLAGAMILVSLFYTKVYRHK